MLRSISLITSLVVLTIAAPRVAAQNEPNGPHPRIWLDADTLETLRAQAATDADSAAARAVDRCAVLRAEPDRFDEGVWRGFEFAGHLSVCALAYQITLSPDDAATAIRYLEALLDDHDVIGDGAGGDDVVQLNHGYQMRVFAPWSAIGYDWLFDAPGMTTQIKARARQRFKAWTDWYREEGYLNDMPGANFHAGYVFGTTLIAIAQGGEAEGTSAELWQFVRDSLWGVDMAEAVAPGGVLDGGDWPEGWNYGPFSVMEYALAVRALNEQGLLLEDFDRWTGSLILRQLSARPPSGGEWVGGDAGDEEDFYEPISSRTVFATIAGTAPEAMREHARALVDELGLAEEEYFYVFQGLAEARAGNATPLPAEAPTWYMSRGNHTLYARSAWSQDATWTTLQCAPLVIADHQHLNAGNVVVSRGVDNVLVDPSPYGSYSTLTGNAPTVRSANLPDTYQPSQGNWGQADVGFAWAHQTASGAIVARCDYRGQYRFRGEAEPDLDYAVRDTLVLPHAGGSTTVVLDRVDTGDAGRPLLLRFRTPGSLTLAGDVASATVGGSMLHIRRLAANAGTPAVRTPPVGDCYTEVDRGKCEVARIAVDEYYLDVPHAAPMALHLLDATGTGVAAPDATYVDGDGFGAAVFERDGARFAVVAGDRPAPPNATFSYRVPAGGDRLHVVLDAPGIDGRAEVSASAEGGDCAVTVTAAAGGAHSVEPLTMMVAGDCSVAADPATEPLLPENSDGTVGEGSDPSDPSGGCCDTGGGSSPLAVLLLGALVLAVVRRQR